MNVAFFLIPKKDVVFIDADLTMRQAIEKMEYRCYAVVLIIDKEGKYVGTLTEKDLLWKLRLFIFTIRIKFTTKTSIYIDIMNRFPSMRKWRTF
jgi:CBS domain-containing protein